MPETAYGAKIASQLLPSTGLLKAVIGHDMAKDSDMLAAVRQKISKFLSECSPSSFVSNLILVSNLKNPTEGGGKKQMGVASRVCLSVTKKVFSRGVLHGLTTLCEAEGGKKLLVFRATVLNPCFFPLTPFRENGSKSIKTWFAVDFSMV